MPPKTIFFAGAPLPSDLPPLVRDGGSSEPLTFFSSRIARFAGLETQSSASDSAGTASSSLTADQPYAAWHSLPLKGEHLATGYSQIRGWTEGYRGNAAYYAAEDPTFLSTQGETSFSQSSAEQDGSLRSRADLLEDVTSQFYEHSLALHDDLPTSQIAPAASGAQSLDESDYSTSFNTTSLNPTQDESLLSNTTKQPIPNVGPITPLNRLPTETYLKSISPQTMSISILCGIISISAPRAITTRHGSTISLIEALVGDDHTSGFAINFWVPPVSKPSALRTALQDLRPQDIILVKNLALGAFRGKVYGQSLRREMTKVHLLYRTRLDRQDRGGCFGRGDLEGEEAGMQPLVVKTRRVREWVLRFVGGGRGVVGNGDRTGTGEGRGKRTREVAGLGEMPPDTQ